MNVVFGGGLWPIGWSVGFIEAGFAEVARAMRDWHTEIGRKESWTDVDGPLPKLLALLAPLQTPPKRELIVGTERKWSAIFDNSRLGGDPNSAVHTLSRRLARRSVVATHIPRGQYRYPSTKFVLIGDDGASLRTVYAGIYDEGRWLFDAYGEVQGFEEVEAYGRRLKRERLTREMLLDYLWALDIRADDPSFYGEGALIENRDSWRPGWTAGVEKARRQCLGIDPWT